MRSGWAIPLVSERTLNGSGHALTTRSHEKQNTLKFLLLLLLQQLVISSKCKNRTPGCIYVPRIKPDFNSNRRRRFRDLRCACVGVCCARGVHTRAGAVGAPRPLGARRSGIRAFGAAGWLLQSERERERVTRWRCKGLTRCLRLGVSVQWQQREPGLREIKPVRGRERDKRGPGRVGGSGGALDWLRGGVWMSNSSFLLEPNNGGCEWNKAPRQRLK